MSATNGKTDRLASALRANLARRKTQARARRAGDESQPTSAASPLAGPQPTDSEPVASADVTDPAGMEHKERIVPEDEAG